MPASAIHQPSLVSLSPAHSFINSLLSYVSTTQHLDWPAYSCPLQDCAFTSIFVVGPLQAPCLPASLKPSLTQLPQVDAPAALGWSTPIPTAEASPRPLQDEEGEPAESQSSFQPTVSSAPRQAPLRQVTCSGSNSIKNPNDSLAVTFSPLSSHSVLINTSHHILLPHYSRTGISPSRLKTPCSICVFGETLLLACLPLSLSTSWMLPIVNID